MVKLEFIPVKGKTVSAIRESQLLSWIMKTTGLQVFFFYLEWLFLTCSLSIELKPHGDVPKPRVRFDFHEAGVNARSQRMCNNAVTIVVGRENLEKRIFL